MHATISLLVLLGGEALALGGTFVPQATDNCTANSGSRSYWTIDDLILKVYNWDNGGSMGTFGFRSYYSGTNKTVECLVENVDLAKLGDGPWSKCGSTGTQFRFDLNDISLAMRETWTCSDSPGVVFSANSTGSIMLHGCLDNNTDKGIESDCNLMELEMAANITISTDK
ncbi:hypothetical protein QBC47DRAFT_366201 [Echria macrotheca]|uniref:AA1-like domain-containing protein n=1 Tax=Echria macrotheca TaxID=438768 RepID=A0AAJ0B4U2_9PEZI|nr:hypothetical protein QBC47DRAFT_366201 [Echria macrotheca]